jgi:hypothetical protein
MGERFPAFEEGADDERGWFGHAQRYQGEAKPGNEMQGDALP